MTDSSINRRDMLKTTALTTAALTQSSLLADAGDTRKNVVLIISDDHGLDMPCYGNTAIRTPHLDALARSGVRFTNSFCTTPSCSASRSVIYTGMQNHRNGHYGHAHDYHHFSLFSWVKPLPLLLKEQGYHTGLIGKFHVNSHTPFGWDRYITGRTVGGNRNVTRMAEYARTFFEESTDQPFFLTVGFSDPHRARVGFGNETNQSEIEPVVYSPDEVEVPGFLPDEPEVREELADYYQSVSRMDAGVGLVLKALEETGNTDSTLVLYISDNGIPFPGAKTCLYDAGIRLPMLMRVPGITQPESVSEAMVSFADITPTILDWTGTPEPEYGLDGQSILPVIQENPSSGREEVFFSHTFHEITMYYPSRGVRTPRFKYIHNLAHPLPFPFASDLWASKTWQGILERNAPLYGGRGVQDYLYRPEEELYDIVNDPYETRNLAEDPDYRETLVALRESTEAHRRRTKDPWLILNNYPLPDPD